jgi:phosphoglycerate dehydrogenase-like enzyme
MRVVWYDPYVPAGASMDVGRRAETLADLLPEVDLLSIHAPLTPGDAWVDWSDATGDDEADGHPVSVARGGIVDETALYEALSSGRLFGAALDVFEKEPPAAGHPLFRIPTFVATPHVGAGTIDSREQTSVAVAEQLLEVLKGGEGRNVLA